MSENSGTHKCPVCRKHAFSALSSYEICPICKWEDDPIQTAAPDYEGGANGISLNKYIEQYAKD